MRAVQRARLCAITCTASQAPLAAKRPRGEMVQPHAVLEVAYRILDLGVTAMIGLQFQRLGSAAGGDGPALAQPGHQHLAGAGGDGQQRVIAPHTGVAVVAGALLGQSVGLADRRINVDGEWCVAGSGTGLPDPGQQLAAHPVQLADMAPPEAAQEGAQGGGSLSRETEHVGGPAGAQHIGVVDAISAG